MIRAVTFLAGILVLTLGSAATADGKKPAELITKAGTHKLYDGKLVVTVTEGVTGTQYKFTRPFGDGRLIGYGSAKKDAIKKGTDWFIYPASAEKVWVFTGTELLQVAISYEGTVVKGASVVPAIVKAAPELVRKRLPDEFKKKYPDK